MELIPSSKNSQKRKIRSHLIRNPILIEPLYRPQLLYLPSNYQIFPSPQEIAHCNFIVENLLIKNEWAQVEWKGIVDLSTLQQPLSETIDFGCCFVEVYRSDRGKPIFGKGLNKRCLATFAQLKKVSKKKLQKVCNVNGTKLISTNALQKTFMVQIPHFTRFEFDASPDSDEEVQEIAQNRNLVLPTRGSERDLSIAHQIIASAFSRTSQEGSSLKLRSSHRIKHTQIPFPFTRVRLQQDIDNHNRQKSNYQIPRTYQTMFSSNEKAFRFFRQKDAYVAQQVERVQDLKFEQLGAFLDCIKGGPQYFQELIVQQNRLSARTRRVIALIQIIWDFENTHLYFDTSEYQGQTFKVLKKRDLTPRNNELDNYLKDWLEWVIKNNNFDGLFDPILGRLAFRRPDVLVQEFLEQGYIEDAQFVASIEDEVYRYDVGEKRIISELACIDLENSDMIYGMHWLQQLGIQVWYFIKTDMRRKLSYIIDKHFKKLSEYIMEFRVFQIFATSLGKMARQLPSATYEQNLQELLCTWYISYRLGEIQKKHYLNNEYEKYRWRLAQRILHKMQYVEDMVLFLTAENYLNQNTKHELLKQVLMGRPDQCGKLLSFEWPKKQQIIDEVAALEYLSANQFHLALQRLIRIPQIDRSPLIKQKIIQISLMNSLVLNFRRQVLERHLKLVQRCNYSQLQTVKVILNMRLGIAFLDAPTLRILCQYASSLGNLNGATLMNLALPIIQNCKTFPTILANNDTLRQDLLRLYAKQSDGWKYLNNMCLTFKAQKTIVENRALSIQQILKSKGKFTIY